MAAVYRRYGGTVDGEVIRLELMARGLLEIVENRISDTYIQRRWKHNPISTLANRWLLLTPGSGLLESTWTSLYSQGPDRSFERYSLHAGICRQLEPAGPAAWSIAPAGPPRTR